LLRQQRLFLGVVYCHSAGLASFLTKQTSLYTEKKWFCYGNKVGTTNNFFVAATKNFAAATKRFVDRTKHFVVVTKYFCYPYFNK